MAGQPVVVDGTVYVNAYAGPAAPTLLAYDVAADRWSTPPTPPGGSELLTAAGDRPVIYPGSHEQGASGTGYALDPATGRWAALPADPLGKGFDRRFAWTGDALVLLDRELVPNPGADGPSIARAAVLTDPFGPDAAWKRLPDSEVMSTDPVLVDGDLLIIPNVGGADGGQVNGYGREYPFGGVLDVPANRWSDLPPEDLPDRRARRRVRRRRRPVRQPCRCGPRRGAGRLAHRSAVCRAPHAYPPRPSSPPAATCSSSVASRGAPTTRASCATPAGSGRRAETPP